MRFPKLPEHCPECNAPFSTLRRPAAHYTKLGMLLLLLIAPTAIVSAGTFALLIWAVRVFPRKRIHAGAIPIRVHLPRGAGLPVGEATSRRHDDLP
jgi:hypothetical protein